MKQQNRNIDSLCSLSVIWKYEAKIIKREEKSVVFKVWAIGLDSIGLDWFGLDGLSELLRNTRKYWTLYRGVQCFFFISFEWVLIMGHENRIYLPKKKWNEKKKYKSQIVNALKQPFKERVREREKEKKMHLQTQNDFINSILRFVAHVYCAGRWLYFSSIFLFFSCSPVRFGNCIVKSWTELMPDAYVSNKESFFFFSLFTSCGCGCFFFFFIPWIRYLSGTLKHLLCCQLK